MPEHPTFTQEPDADRSQSHSLADPAGTVPGPDMSVPAADLLVTALGPDADPDATTGSAGPPVHTASPTATGRYTLGDELARGGMGVVYRAIDTILGREVAVKVLQEKFAPNSGTARRFADEARIAAQLQHPAIPPVHDLGILNDGRPFLAMKLIRGDTLQELLKQRSDVTTDRGRFVAAFEQICQAIAYAHAHRVIHRDLKPANIMVGSFGEVQVMDWGLAKVLGSPPTAADDPDATTGGTEVRSLRDTEGTLTQAGSIMGTPAFMPPEQAVGAVGKIDERSDVFGLGAVLAVILTGVPPFLASSAETTRLQAAQGDVEECFARLDASGAEPDLIALCKRCLSPKPTNRPENAGEVARAVAELRQAADERARQAELDRVKAEGDKAAAELQSAEQRKRRKLAMVAAGVLSAVLLAGVIGTTIGLLQAQEAKEAERLRADGEQKAREGEAEALRIAISQSDLSYDALGDLVLKIQMDLDEAPGGRHVRKELLEDTMKKLHRLYQSPTTSDRLFRRYTTAHQQMGQILWTLNRRDEAVQEYNKAGEYAEQAFRANPTSDKAKANIAGHNNRMGDTELYYYKRLEPARKWYLAALAGWKELADRMVAYPNGDPALPELERMDLARCEEALADTYARLGILELRWEYDYAKAEEYFNTSLTIRKRLVEKAPSYESRDALTLSILNLGELALQHNELPKALALHEELVKQRQAIFSQRQWSLKARRDLAEALALLGNDLACAKRDDEAKKMYLASRELNSQVLAAEPNDPLYRGLVAHDHYLCGTAFLRLGDPKKAQHEFEEGLKLRQLNYSETQDEEQKFNMLPPLMLSLARCGHYVEAAKLAAKVREKLGVMPGHLAEAASCYGLCRAAVGAGKSAADLTPEENQLRQSYLDKAIECLEEARQNKYDDILYVERDADFDTLRGVPEYERWLDSFRASLKARR